MEREGEEKKKERERERKRERKRCTVIRKRWCIKDTRQLVHKNKNEVEHAWGFNRAEEVLDIVDYLARLTN